MSTSLAARDTAPSRVLTFLALYVGVNLISPLLVVRTRNSFVALVRKLAMVGIPALAALGCLLLVRRVYYGHFVPNTYFVKGSHIPFDIKRLAALSSQGVGPTEAVVWIGGSLLLLVFGWKRKYLAPALSILACGYFATSVLLDWMPSLRHLLPITVLAPLGWVVFADALMRRKDNNNNRFQVDASSRRSARSGPDSNCTESTSQSGRSPACWTESTEADGAEGEVQWTSCRESDFAARSEQLASALRTAPEAPLRSRRRRADSAEGAAPMMKSRQLESGLIVNAAPLAILAILGHAAYRLALIDNRNSPEEKRSGSWIRPKTVEKWHDTVLAYRRIEPPHVTKMGSYEMGQISQSWGVLETSAEPVEDSWFAGRDIGAVGYYTGVRIFDTAGLFTKTVSMSPEWTEQRKVSDTAIRTMMAHRPLGGEIYEGWEIALGSRPELLKGYRIRFGSMRVPNAFIATDRPPPAPAEVLRRYRLMQSRFPQLFHLHTLYGESVGAVMDRRVRIVGATWKQE